MKNFLCIENINTSKNDVLFEIIKSSSEMEGYPITNILESDEKTLWLSIEQLPQEIIINLTKDLFKELPKKISAIGIYCWHAYPTNPKLIEIQISKNKGMSFISLGNFDLCLKPGKQLLQFDYEINPSLVKDNISDIIIKLIIKETFGDKRTYINNIYLYENINLIQKDLMPNMEPIKEEDSNSMIYLRESRERVFTKNFKEINTIQENKNNKINNDESDSLISDSDLSEKYNKENNKDGGNKNIEINNIKKTEMKNNDRYLNENENEILMEMNKQINLMLEKENMNNIQQENEISSKEKSLNINDFNNEEENEKSNSFINNDINEQTLNLLIDEFNKYKQFQEKRMFDYENKIKHLEIEYNEMLLLNNKMKETLDTLLEAQMIRQNDNGENILNNMRDIIYNKINNVFNNFNPMGNYNNYNNYNMPFNNNRNFYFNNNENYFDNNNININRRMYNNNKIPINIKNNIYERNISEKDYHTNNNFDNNNQNNYINYSFRENQYSTINNKNRIKPINININNDNKYINSLRNKSKKDNIKYKDNK